MLTCIHECPLIQAPLLNSHDWLIHGFGIKDVTIEKYLKAFGFENTLIPKTHQSHGNTVSVLKRDTLHSSRTTIEADAFIIDQPGIVCWVRTADCLPILLVDTKNRAVGAVHAGWQGTAQKIILETLEKFRKEWKSDFADLKVALGPAIGGRCYRVGEDVVSVFEKAGLYPAPWIEERDRGHWYLDIAFANLHLLETAGIKREQVYLSLACTACDLKKFHSFRKEKGKKGEQVSFIVIR